MTIHHQRRIGDAPRHPVCATVPGDSGRQHAAGRLVANAGTGRNADQTAAIVAERQRRIARGDRGEDPPDEPPGVLVDPRDCG